MTISMDMNFGFYFSFCEINIIFYDLQYPNRALWILVWALIIYLIVRANPATMVCEFPFLLLNCPIYQFCFFISHFLLPA
jgi:hypothetical protein